jgi:hypothetical protein
LLHPPTEPAIGQRGSRTWLIRVNHGEDTNAADLKRATPIRFASAFRPEFLKLFLMDAACSDL